MTESACRAYSPASTPMATAALNSRAPSMCTFMPSSRLFAETASISPRLQA